MDEPTVTVEALIAHTADGVPHQPGERYDAPAWMVDFLVRAGYAKPVA